MWDSITNFQLNSYLAISLYWMPMLVNAIGFTLRTYWNYQKDRRNREKVDDRLYFHTDTIGNLIARAIATALPIVNLFAALFNVLPDLIEKLIDLLDKYFDQPLVPDNESFKAIREGKK